MAVSIRSLHASEPLSEVAVQGEEQDPQVSRRVCWPLLLCCVVLTCTLRWSLVQPHCACCGWQHAWQLVGTGHPAAPAAWLGTPGQLPGLQHQM
jgi:hypothetical protein